MIEFKQSERILEICKMPVREECEVVVAGGGITGIAAALASARSGASTVLVEQNTFLGGSLLGECGAWGGFYSVCEQANEEPVRLVKGIPDQIIEKLIERKGSTGFYKETVGGSGEALRIHGDREELPQLLLELLKEAGVTLYLSSMAVDAVKEGDCVKGIILAGKYGREVILAKTVIDATGSGSVARKAGVNCFQDPKRHFAAISLGLGNIDLNRIKAYAQQEGILTSLGYADKGGGQKDRITRIGIKIGDLDEMKPFLRDTYINREIIITSNHEGRATQLSAASLQPNHLGVEEITKAYLKLNKDCFILAKLLKQFIPGFEKSFVDWTSPYLSLDYGYSVDCRYQISREDLLNGTVPEDSIGAAAVIANDLNKKNGWFGIPYRALLPENMDNLLVAGKMISFDDLVQQSTGTTGACFLQGQAAGAAAAIAAKSGCSVIDISISELQRALISMGAYLGLGRDTQ